MAAIARSSSDEQKKAHRFGAGLLCSMISFSWLGL
jgi:hypothetical protein